MNVHRAMDAGYGIIGKGHYPLIPHITHYFDLFCDSRYGTPLGYETYMQWDFVLLRRCDGLLYMAPSPGADRELALARELGLPIWLSVEEVPAA